MNRSLFLSVCGALLLLLSAGCGHGWRLDAGNEDRLLSQAVSAEGFPKEASRSERGADVDASTPAADRILIYTAQMRMAVADVDVSLAAVRKLAEEAGGYLQSLQNVSITIRVPVGQYQAVLHRIGALGQTLAKSIHVQDVTDDYVDLQLRLANLEAARDRLLAVMQKAGEVKDILAVEKELTRVSEEIERIKGRLAHLEKQVRFSTITVIFTQAGRGQIPHRRPVLPFAWVNDLGIERVLLMGR